MTTTTAPATKVCTKCNRELPLNCFPEITRKATGKKSHSSWCRACKNQCVNALNTKRRAEKAIAKRITPTAKPDHDLAKSLTKLTTIGLDDFIAQPVHSIHDKKALQTFAKSANQRDHETIWRFLTRT